MYFSYQQRIMNSNARINVVQAPRMSGRTHLCMEWLLADAASMVLYIAPSQGAVDAFISHLKTNYGQHIERHDRSLIRFKNRLVLHACTPSLKEGLRSMQTNRIAIDNAGYVKWDDGVDLLASCGAGNQALIIGDDAKKNSILDYCLSNTAAGGYYDQYTAEEAVDEGVYTKDDYSAARESMTAEQFHREFGPWDRITNWHANRKNRDYIGVLNT